jgi:hypothetical protein
MSEDRTVYNPPQGIVTAAHVPDYDALRTEAAADPVAFWEARAKELGRASWTTPTHRSSSGSLVERRMWS